MAASVRLVDASAFVALLISLEAGSRTCLTHEYFQQNIEMYHAYLRRPKII